MTKSGALCFVLLGSATCFTPPATRPIVTSLSLSVRHGSGPLASTALWSAAADNDTTRAATTTDQDHFYRAVEIADSIRSSNSKLNIQELDKWATELEQVQNCVFEDVDNQELCQKEIQDRLEVAQIFRLEIELKLRLNYLKHHSNLFADDVRKNHDKIQRQKFKQALLDNREKAADRGSDLGLW